MAFISGGARHMLRIGIALLVLTGCGESRGDAGPGRVTSWAEYCEASVDARCRVYQNCCTSPTPAYPDVATCNLALLTGCTQVTTGMSAFLDGTLRLDVAGAQSHRRRAARQCTVVRAANPPHLLPRHRHAGSRR